jgi:hypothetical protein
MEAVLVTFYSTSFSLKIGKKLLPYRPTCF